MPEKTIKQLFLAHQKADAQMRAASERKHELRVQIDAELARLAAEGKHVTADLEIKGGETPDVPGRVDAVANIKPMGG